MTDYSEYKMNLREKLSFLAINAGIVFLTMKLFYNITPSLSFTWESALSIIVPALICIPFSYFAFRYEAAFLCKKRLHTLTIQFAQALSSISVSLSIGYSFENSIKETYLELSGLYGEKSYICIELMHILRQLSIGTAAEDCFREFALRTASENILNFSDVLYIAKRNSGNINKIISDAILRIKDKIDLERQLEALVSARNFEKNIMIAMPPAIIAYINLIANDFLLPMYTTILGRCVMTLALAIYIFSIYLSQKILAIS